MRVELTHFFFCRGSLQIRTVDYCFAGNRLSNLSNEPYPLKKPNRPYLWPVGFSIRGLPAYLPCITLFIGRSRWTCHDAGDNRAMPFIKPNCMYVLSHFFPNFIQRIYIKYEIFLLYRIIFHNPLIFLYIFSQK